MAPDGGPIGPGSMGTGGQSIQAPNLFTGGSPIGGPASTFNAGGAPIAILGGVFSGGLPIAGPVTQIYRGGFATPPPLFFDTLTSAGPIGNFTIGQHGAPIGIPTIGGGGLPIEATMAIVRMIVAVQPRTALVGRPAVAFRRR